MDLFPDWSEIGVNVKVWMVAFHFCCIVLAYLVCFKVGKTATGGARKLGFAALVIGTGLALFLSMFLFDWSSVLP